MPKPSAIRRVLSVALPPLLLSAVAAVGIEWAAGGTLGVFIGGVLIVTILTPPAVLAADRTTDRLLALAVTFIPVCLLWLIAAWRTQTRLGEWLGCAAVLITYAMALAGVSVGLRAIRLSATLSAALTVIVGLAWLTWPIWLSRTWDGEASAGWVGRLVTVHPALAINLRHLGQWSEQSVAYHLTDLNQTVSYAPPSSVWTCVLAHGSVGVVLLSLAALLDVPRRRRDEAPDVQPGL